MAFPRRPVSAPVHLAAGRRLAPPETPMGRTGGYSGRYLADRWWPEHNGIALFDCRATRHPRCGHPQPREGPAPSAATGPRSRRPSHGASPSVPFLLQGPLGDHLRRLGQHPALAEQLEPVGFHLAHQHEKTGGNTGSRPAPGRSPVVIVIAIPLFVSTLARSDTGSVDTFLHKLPHRTTPEIVTID
jgi:hypothetical protein